MLKLRLGGGVTYLLLNVFKIAVNLKTKMIFQVLVYFLFFFIGVEYVLILPSLKGYLETLDIGSNFVGICIAAVNFAALLTATPLGRLAGKFPISPKNIQGKSHGIKKSQKDPAIS